MKITSKSIEIGGKTLILEHGRFAGQATSAVLGRLGDTMVLAAVVSGGLREDVDFFPLQVEYVERLYAGGRIKGSRWVKREGRPSDEAILTARLIDRSIRPLFPEGFRNEVQVIVTVLSVDSENNPDIPAVCATSAALAISSIPWNGPVGVLRVGFVPKDGQDIFISNPTHQDLDYSDLDLIVSSTDKAVVMLEGGAKNIPEETVLKGIEFGQAESQKVIKAINELQQEIGVKKTKFEAHKPDATLVSHIEKEIMSHLPTIVSSMASKEETAGELEEIKKALIEKYPQESKQTIFLVVDKLIKKAIRSGILEKGKRPDGRKPTEIRPLEMEVGILPRTHGSAMFKRGSTQALTVTTLGAPSLGQMIENMEGEETKRYIHHYNMPPFSLGEVGKVGSPSRREIGHGALAERAIEPVIPPEEKFPYTIMVVSEIMSSNGSTSMASVCGSTLSLMDAGVPIKSPVAGIAMGVITDGEKQVILTDIIGLEDFNGDMDCKVAGTRTGVTAIQMDVKSTSLTTEILKKAFTQAKEARVFILDQMQKTLPTPRANISKFAPKIEVVHVPVEKIGEVIGPGGKIIRKIIAETGANVEVEDDGTVNVSALDKGSVDKAIAWIEGLTREVKAGEEFEGTVKRIQPFGAFVEVLPGKEGLVHVSRMAQGYVANPADIVKVGQKVKVKVNEIDDMGRINLTMLFGEKVAPPPSEKTLPPRR